MYLKMNLTREKQKNLILFFLNKSGGKIDRLKLLKLIWIGDRLHMNKYGRTISKDLYAALPYGPVPSQIFNFTKENGLDFLKVNNYDIETEKEFNSDYFSNSDLEVMNYIWNNFNTKNSIPFSEYSHKFAEWKRYESLLNDKYSPNSYPIVIEDFFEFPDISEFEDIISNDIVKESKNYYLKHNSVQEFLTN